MSTFLLDDVRVFLEAAGLGLTFGTNLFAGMAPDDPDSITVAYEYPGMPPEYVMGTRSLPAIAQPGLQIIVRDPSYQTSRSACEAATRALETIANTTVNTTYYERVARKQDPFMLHRDNKRRVIFACNFDVQRTPT